MQEQYKYEKGYGLVEYLKDQVHDLRGTGDWRWFDNNLETIMKAAARWKKELEGVEKPWLCWCCEPDWCLVQQKLVKKAGWTPVVGQDKKETNVKLVEGAIFIDFNREFGYPIMWGIFPLEWVFLFCEKLAFWHSDVILDLQTMKKISNMFDQLANGETCAIRGWSHMDRLLRKTELRYWEVLCCTTKDASFSQFKNGCGWWRSPVKHINFKKVNVIPKRDSFWDHGAGIYLWKKYFKGKVKAIGIDIGKSHFSRSSKFKSIKPSYREGKSHQLKTYFDLAAIIRQHKLEGI
jgi:hypothetical protein